MKIICLLFLMYFFNSCTQYNECTVLISGTKVNFCKSYDRNLIIRTFGNPLKIESENGSLSEGDEEAWTVYSYDGLKVNLTGKNIDEIIISNQKWSINQININTPLNEINKHYAVYKKEKNYIYYRLGRKSDIIFYVKNNKSNIIELAIVSL